MNQIEKTITKEVLCNLLANIPMELTYNVILQDRYYDAIVGAFKAQNGPVRFCWIYPEICRRLGATEEDALRGFAPCPYSNAIIDQKGRIRSWVEERSPHSRQYYFRAGKRTNWKAGDRPLLFINPILGEMNNNNDWMPYTHARGAGWSFNPVEANLWLQPSDEILDRAASAYRRQGMRGAVRTNLIQNVPIIAIKA